MGSWWVVSKCCLLFFCCDFYVYIFHNFNVIIFKIILEPPYNPSHALLREKLSGFVCPAKTPLKEVCFAHQTFGEIFAGLFWVRLVCIFDFQNSASWDLTDFKEPAWGASLSPMVTGDLAETTPLESRPLWGWRRLNWTGRSLRWMKFKWSGKICLLNQVDQQQVGSTFCRWELIRTTSVGVTSVD